VVAIDGPSGTGKTTVARKLAAKYGASYLDTGAMYRIATLAVLRAEVDLSDEVAIIAIVRELNYEVSTDPSRVGSLLAGEDVSVEIRGEAVTHAVSPVASVAGVRELLGDAQRRIIDEALASVGGIVVEGRDIGTSVAPDAQLKIFLTADAKVRAARRSSQDRPADHKSTVDEIEKLNRRDRIDSTRVVNPTRAAEDAVHLDSTELTIDQVLVALAELANQRGLLGDRVAELPS
jgi:cytidylate kinase